MALPQQAGAQGSNAESAKHLIVLRTRDVAGKLLLVQVGITDSVAGVLYASPKLHARSIAAVEA